MQFKEAECHQAKCPFSWKHQLTHHLGMLSTRDKVVKLNNHWFVIYVKIITICMQTDIFSLLVCKFIKNIVFKYVNLYWKYLSQYIVSLIQLENDSRTDVFLDCLVEILKSTLKTDF